MKHSNLLQEFKKHTDDDIANFSEIKESVRDVKNSLDRHLEIYAQNGKELAGVKHEMAQVKLQQEVVKTNQEWLMRFFWIFMTPIIGGIVYLILHIK